MIVKRVKGIRRAAMGPVMPNKAGGKTVILDCGANAECTAEFLLQFGLVGSLYAKKYLGIANPRVGLLNIGAEDTKGTPLQKEAYALLSDAAEKGLLNLTGNVEARDVPLGAVDVVVCDGFSGNVLLKTIEGTAMFMGSLMKPNSCIKSKILNFIENIFLLISLLSVLSHKFCKSIASFNKFFAVVKSSNISTLLIFYIIYVLNKNLL